MEQSLLLLSRFHLFNWFAFTFTENFYNCYYMSFRSFTFRNRWKAPILYFYVYLSFANSWIHCYFYDRFAVMCARWYFFLLFQSLDRTLRFEGFYNGYYPALLSFQVGTWCKNANLDNSGRIGFLLLLYLANLDGFSKLAEFFCADRLQLGSNFFYKRFSQKPSFFFKRKCLIIG